MSRLTIKDHIAILSSTVVIYFLMVIVLFIITPGENGIDFYNLTALVCALFAALIFKHDLTEKRCEEEIEKLKSNQN